jgi:hypothetical protein
VGLPGQTGGLGLPTHPDSGASWKVKRERIMAMASLPTSTHTRDIQLHGEVILLR